MAKRITKIAAVQAILGGGGWYSAGDVADILSERYRIRTNTPNTDICDVRKKGVVIKERRGKKGRKEFRILSTGEGGSNPTVASPPSLPVDGKGQHRLF